MPQSRARMSGGKRAIVRPIILRVVGNEQDRDMTAPLLQQTLPADNSTGVSVTANLSLVFNEAVKANSGFIRIYT